MFSKMTPDFGLVKASYQMVGVQCYRAVVKDKAGQSIFVSIDTFRNRDTTTSVSMSAAGVAANFINNELKAIGAARYNEGLYSHNYKGPAPFFDAYEDTYQCLNGYWFRVRGDRLTPTSNIPASVLKSASTNE